MTACLLSAPVVFAQQNESDEPATFEEEATERENDESETPEATEKTGNAAGSNTAAEAEPEPEQPAVNPDATFTPTEEISEDKPVAFPVDI